MEQIPVIAGVWSEVRCQTRHTKPMRKMDWAFITSSGWLYVNTEREASCRNGCIFCLTAVCIWHSAISARIGKQTPCGSMPATALRQKCCWISESGDHLQSLPKRRPQTRKRKPRSIIGCWSIRLPRSRDLPTMTDGRTGMIFDWLPSGQDWAQLFAEDLQWSIRQTLRGCADGQTARPCTCRPAELARSWFLSCYPLLGAVAARFCLIADSAVVSRLGVSIAAVSCRMAEIYINPYAGLRTEEWRFVLAHEFLHAALQHAERLNGRHRCSGILL